MVAQVNATGNQDIDGLLWGYQWSNEIVGGVLTYSFPTSAGDYTYTTTGFEAFNAAQQTAVVQSLNMISSYINVSFQVAGVGQTSWLRFAEATTVDGSSVPTAFANPPGNPGDRVGDSWYNHTSYNSPGIGTFAMQAGIMHEIGHNMGLKHGHAAQTAHGYLFPTLPSDHDSYEYSVMTYRQYVGDNPATGDNAPEHATTYMINDIAAMQYMYGANFNTNAGNTTYTWNSTTGEFQINGVGQGASVAGAYIFMALWDGNGTDTYNLSNFSEGMTINLIPGSYSVIPSMLANLGDGVFARGAIYNAYQYYGNTASLIENAVGGSGTDTMYGNQAANTLTGGGGNDTILGFDGNDALVGDTGVDYILGGNGNDAVTGGALGDLIDGGEGDDTLWGHDPSGLNDGDDLINGNNGNDSIVGHTGADRLYGGAGGDQVAGGAGGDAIYGEAGNDILWGHDGTGVGDLADYIDGGAGNDTIVGHTGNNVMLGGDGQDTIYGGDDNDLIFGDAGNDTLIGNGGADDYYYMAGNFGADNIYGFNPGQDQIVFSSALFASFAAVQAALVVGAGYVVIVAPNGQGQIALHGIGGASLTAADFVFL